MSDIDDWMLDRRARDGRCDDCASERVNIWPAGGRAERGGPAGSLGRARRANADAGCDDCGVERADTWAAVTGPGAHDPLADIADPVWGGTDWQLLRKFATFWPADEPAPPAFPWLGTLVSRRKAWRWVSQFPRHFADVHPDDHGVILDFIGRTLTDVEPSASEDGEKKCCKPKPKPSPEIDLFPPCDKKGPGSWTESCDESRCTSLDLVAVTSTSEGASGAGRRCVRDCCNGLEGIDCGECYWLYVA